MADMGPSIEKEITRNGCLNTKKGKLWLWSDVFRDLPIEKLYIEIYCGLEGDFNIKILKTI
jgi:hypothetical protein